MSDTINVVVKVKSCERCPNHKFWGGHPSNCQLDSSIKWITVMGEPTEDNFKPLEYLDGSVDAEPPHLYIHNPMDTPAQDWISPKCPLRKVSMKEFCAQITINEQEHIIDNDRRI